MSSLIRAALSEYRRPQVLGQRLRREHVHGNPEKPAKLGANRADVEQRGFRRRVDQEIEIAPLGVLPGQDGPEHSRVAGAVGRDDAPDRLAVVLQSLGGLHAVFLTGTCVDAWTCVQVHLYSSLISAAALPSGSNSCTACPAVRLCT